MKKSFFLAFLSTFIICLNLPASSKFIFLQGEIPKGWSVNSMDACKQIAQQNNIKRFRCCYPFLNTSSLFTLNFIAPGTGTQATQLYPGNYGALVLPNNAECPPQYFNGLPFYVTVLKSKTDDSKNSVIKNVPYAVANKGIECNSSVCKPWNKPWSGGNLK